jgi:lysozyme family protein
MPEDVWLKIARDKFWDKIHLDELKSQAVAHVIFSWQWGSGYAWRDRMVRYLQTKGIVWNKSDFKGLILNLNTLIEKEGEKKIFDELIEQKKQFLLSIGEGSNPGGIYTKGWMNRLEDLRKYSVTFIGKGTDIVKKKGNSITVIIVALAIVAVYVLYSTLKKKNK